MRTSDCYREAQLQGLPMRNNLYIYGLLTDADIAWMARAGARRGIEDGEILIHEGRPIGTIILLLQGECVVTDRAIGEIARLGVGEILGEMSFVDSASPSATVTASGEGLALFLDKETLARKIEADTAFGCRFYRALAIFLAARLRGAVRRLGYSGATTLDAQAIEMDDLDPGSLVVDSMARDRFDQMFKLLADES
jgi:CRP-like cAMP-binding protein